MLEKNLKLFAVGFFTIITGWLIVEAARWYFYNKDAWYIGVATCLALIYLVGYLVEAT